MPRVITPAMSPAIAPTMEPINDTFTDGVRAGLPVVLGYMGIGIAAGVVERARGAAQRAR